LGKCCISLAQDGRKNHSDESPQTLAVISGDFLLENGPADVHMKIFMLG
jgi:hypothetical protein